MELLGPVAVAGPLTASMIAAARCLAQPSFKVQTILRAVLRDEMIAGHKKVQFFRLPYTAEKSNFLALAGMCNTVATEFQVTNRG